MWGLFHLNVPHTQKDDKSRPIFNLRGLNHYIRTTHFKMEGIQSVRDSLQEVDWLTQIDLKDVYFAVPIHRDHQKFLQFILRDRVFQYTSSLWFPYCTMSLYEAPQTSLGLPAGGKGFAVLYTCTCT